MGYCISNSLAGLSVDCVNNIGGIKKAYITPFADNLYQVDATAETITGITTATPVTWKAYNFKKETGSFTSTLNVDAPNGVNYVSTEISLVFARMESAKRLEMKALSLNDLGVVIVDANGNYWGFGVEEPVTASAGSGETGTARGDGNKYGLTLIDYYKSYPMMLTADAITALKTAAGE